MANITRRSLLKAGAIVASEGLVASRASGTQTTPAAAIRTPGSAWTSKAHVRWTGYSASVESVAWRADSRRVAWRASSGQGGVLDTQTGETVAHLPPPQGAGTASGLLWLDDSDTILIGGTVLGQEIYSPVALTLLDGSTGKIVKQVPGLIQPRQEQDPSTTYPKALSYVANTAATIMRDTTSDRVVIVPSDGLNGFEMFDPQTWEAYAQPVETYINQKCSLRPGSSEAALAGAGNTGGGAVLVVDRETGALLHHLEAHPCSTFVVTYSPDGRVLLSAMLAVGFGLSFNIGAPVITPDSDNHKVIAWDATSYDRIGQINSNIRACYDISFHPDGSIFAVGSTDEIAIFETDTLKELTRFRVPTTMLRPVRFSPDGGWLAVGGVGPEFSILEPAQFII